MLRQKELILLGELSSVCSKMDILVNKQFLWKRLSQFILFVVKEFCRKYLFSTICSRKWKPFTFLLNQVAFGNVYRHLNVLEATYSGLTFAKRDSSLSMLIALPISLQSPSSKLLNYTRWAFLFTRIGCFWSTPLWPTVRRNSGLFHQNWLYLWSTHCRPQARVQLVVIGRSVKIFNEKIHHRPKDKLWGGWAGLWAYFRGVFFLLT